MPGGGGNLICCLPQEILDMVIDPLKDDKPTIYACSRTSRRLRESSRRHLFHTLRITASDRQGSVFAKLATFFYNPTSALGVCHHIRKLVLSKSIQLRKVPELHFDLLRWLLERLPNLRTLHLRDIGINGEGIDSEEPQAKFPLQELSLVSVTIDGPYLTLDDILGLFEGIQHLELHDKPKFPIPLPMSSSLELNLEKLSLGFCPDAFLRFLQHTIIQVATLKCILPPNSQALGYLQRFIGFIAPNLVSVQLDLCIMGPSSVAWTLDLDFSICPNLRSLAILSDCSGEWAARLSILSRMPPCLHEITVEFEDRVDIAKLPCRELERLVLEQFADLERVVFYVSPKYRGSADDIFDEPHGMIEAPLSRKGLEDQARKQLAVVLPKLQKRGILRFDAVEM